MIIKLRCWYKSQIWHVFNFVAIEIFSRPSSVRGAHLGHRDLWSDIMTLVQWWEWGIRVESKLMAIALSYDVTAFAYSNRYSRCTLPGSRIHIKNILVHYLAFLLEQSLFEFFRQIIKTFLNAEPDIGTGLLFFLQSSTSFSCFNRFSIFRATFLTLSASSNIRGPDQWVSHFLNRGSLVFTIDDEFTNWI